MTRTLFQFLFLFVALGLSLNAGAASRSEAGAVIERRLGSGGELGKEILILNCAPLNSNSCKISKATNDGRKEVGIINRKEALQLLKSFSKNHKVYARLQSLSRPTTIKPESLSRSSPVLVWSVSVNGERQKGEMSADDTKDPDNVLHLEQEILRRLQ